MKADKKRKRDDSGGDDDDSDDKPSLFNFVLKESTPTVVSPNETTTGLMDKILGFLGDEPKDLARLLKVSRDFRTIVSSKIDKEITTLIGKHIKPTLGQTPCELLRAAKMIQKSTREKWLLPWEPDEDLRRQGFQVGIPNKPDPSPLKGEAIARIPCGDGIFVPIRISFDREASGALPPTETTNMVYLPRQFFHVNCFPSGTFILCDKEPEYVLEQTLNETLQRVQTDLDSERFLCPHHENTYNIYHYGSLQMYKQYKSNCMKLFRGYHLTQPDCWPDLSFVSMAATAEGDRLKLKHEEEST